MPHISSQTRNSTPRQYWGRTGVNLPELDLTRVQRESYQEFLDKGISLDDIFTSILGVILSFFAIRLFF